MIIRTRVLDLWFDESFGPKLWSLSTIKVCIKQALIFKIWMIFAKVMSVHSQKIAKKTH